MLKYNRIYSILPNYLQNKIFWEKKIFLAGGEADFGTAFLDLLMR